MTGGLPQDRITLKGMRFHVIVGILPHEREHPQPLELDLIAWMAPPSGHSGVVDYRTLHAAARDAVAASPREYLEEIAERVAAGALAIDGVRRAEVRIRKPNVPLGAPLDYVEVRIQRPRDA